MIMNRIALICPNFRVFCNTKEGARMMKWRVLVVDDSPFMRKLISDLIESDPSLQVIGLAKDGFEAVEMVRRLNPDVVTLDVEMPGMNGLETLKQILQTHPVPVLMFSAQTEKGAQVTIEALEIGAVDFIHKPTGILSLERVKAELLHKLKTAAQVKVRRPTAQALQAPASDKAPATGRGITPARVIARKRTFDHLFAIGTSTGGPKALQTVLTALPKEFPYPILIVQHMPPKFTHSLARRLDHLAKIPVVEAVDGQLIEGGVAYLAPGGYHMEAIFREPREYRISLNQDLPRNGHRPSVDVLFESVSRLPYLKLHYILMTGMGSDGAMAMLAAKQKGAASTIAESEETCVVFGMPKAAIALGCVDYVVPLEQIANKMIEVSG